MGAVVIRGVPDAAKSAALMISIPPTCAESRLNCSASGLGSFQMNSRSLTGSMITLR